MFDERWNTLKAVAHIRWSEFIPRGTKVLDLGCGTGWLSAYLSQFEETSSIDAVDSDKKNLEEMMPKVVELMKGDACKINAVRGLFAPVRRPNGYYDLVVASSAVHHADNVSDLLVELRRVLKVGGRLLILSETPLPYVEMLFRYVKGMLGLIRDYASKRSRARVPNYSMNGILYDPYLGDHVYSFHQWLNAIVSAGFRYSIVETPYTVYKDVEQGPELTHFVCE